MKKSLFATVALALLSFAATAVDLASLDKDIAGWKAKLADPKARAWDRAVAQVQIWDAEAMTGTEADFAAKRAAIENYLTKPIDGMKPGDQLSLIRNLYRYRLDVRLPGALDLAEKFVKNLGDGGKELKWPMLDFRLYTMRRSESLDEAMSGEARLKLIDEALADPELKKYELSLRERQFETLADLGRDAEAEAYALTVLATTNRQVRLTFHQTLAEFYVGNAERYCSAPDPATLKKAVYQYREYLSLVAWDRNATRRTLHKIAQCLRKAGDSAGARKALDEESELVEKFDERQRKDAVREIAMMRGNLAFEAKDYAGALREWEPYGEAIRTSGGRDVAQLIRMCRALSATGRRADMLPYVEALSKRGNKYTKLRYQYDLEALKKELGQ